MFIQRSFVLAAAAVIVAATLLLLSPWMFGTVFGDQWHESGRYGQALALGLAAQLIASPLSQTLVVLERLTLQIVWDASRVVGTVAGVTVAVHSGLSPIGAVWLLSATAVFFYTLLWCLCYHALRTSCRGDAYVETIGT